ncbi:hypothetical protein ACM26Q_08720 [Kluyvera ascorbata]|uniref:hypothetical protein n=1 Tax=Kluyvera ascorbata TaxID=51288 RepID=UPI0039F6ECCF
MAAGSKVKIVFVEGETELALFQKLKQSKKINVKSVVKKNLWQECIKNYAITIPKGSELFVIFDSDEVGQNERFINNILFLSRRGHNIYLLQQSSNFEEEIAWCCGKSVKKLVSDFCTKRTSGVNDFKRDFIACANPVARLVKLGLQDSKWFSRDLHESLHPLRGMKSKFDIHFTLG